MGPRGVFPTSCSAMMCSWSRSQTCEAKEAGVACYEPLMLRCRVHKMYGMQRTHGDTGRRNETGLETGSLRSLEHSTTRVSIFIDGDTTVVGLIASV